MPRTATRNKQAGSLLKKHRDAKWQFASRLAEEINISPQTLRAYEAEGIPEAVIPQIEEKLGISLSGNSKSGKEKSTQKKSKRRKSTGENNGSDTTQPNTSSVVPPAMEEDISKFLRNAAQAGPITKKELLLVLDFCESHPENPMQHLDSSTISAFLAGLRWRSLGRKL